jgi:hypothetical protein
MSTTKHCFEIHTKSKGKFIPSIQKEKVELLSAMKSIPDSDGKDSRPERPVFCCVTVEASSALKVTFPIWIVGFRVSKLILDLRSSTGIKFDLLLVSFFGFV